MNRKLYVLIFFIASAVILSGSVFILAEDAAPPVPVMPQQLEISPAAVPIDMRADDADKLMQKLKTGTAKLKPAPTETHPGDSTPPTGGISRTIKVRAPEVVNRSHKFQFQDATKRSRPVSAARSMSERRAAVEVYRQSLVKERK